MSPARILLVTPGAKVRHSGNRCTASQWAEILRRQGHRVVVCYDVPESLPASESDLLIAMHAVKCAGVLDTYRAAFPEGKVLLALIVLQEKALEKVPPDCREKTTVVVQSVRPPLVRPGTTRDHFEACVVGHLREVKNPLLAARASRLLPAASRLRLRQAGGILDPAFASLVAREQAENPRYEWLGELSVEEVADLFAASEVMVLTSHSEGGARVVGEAIVTGIPVLSTRIAGVVGLLGEDYPGFFPVDDAEALADLLWSCESDAEFFRKLQEAAAAQKRRFDPAAEASALAAAIQKLAPANPSA